MPERPVLAEVRWRKPGGGPGAAMRARRFRVAALTLVGLAAALGLTIAPPPLPLLVWNVSASAPRGLYAVSPGVAVRPGDMVIARVPAPWRRLAAARRYIPVNVPLVKRVAAGEGDRVCAVGAAIRVNGRRVALRRAVDGRGRAMPRWEGCVTLRGGALFLLMDAPDSFDGRYFGPTAPGDLIGRARLIWRV
jgi:conjugative transfer signal peptidase TraF